MGVPKASIAFRSGTFLSHLSAKLAVRCSPVIVVLGAHIVSTPDFTQPVINWTWRQGQLSSLQCGLRSLPRVADSTLFTLVDHPDPADSTLDSLLRSPAPVAVPTYDSQHGHPVLLRAPIIAELLGLDPAGSAKPVFRRHTAVTDYIAVDDPAVLDDVDDAEALSRFRLRTEIA